MGFFVVFGVLKKVIFIYIFYCVFRVCVWCVFYVYWVWWIVDFYVRKCMVWLILCMMIYLLERFWNVIGMCGSWLFGWFVGFELMVKGGGVDGRCNGGRVVVVFGEMLVFWWLWGWCLLLVVVVWVVYFSYLFEMVWYLLVECVRCSYWLMYCWNMMLLCGIMYVFLLNWNGLFGCIEYRFGFSFCCSSVLDVFVIIMLVLFVRICLKIVMLFG